MNSSQGHTQTWQLEQGRPTWSSLERRAVAWMSRHALNGLKGSLGVLFLTFGVLKFFPALSPAEELAGQTLAWLSFGLVTPSVGLPLLGLWECLMGLGLMLGTVGEERRWMLRLILPLLLLHLAGTALPLVLMPGLCFGSGSGEPLLTLVGQYILKNLVLVSAAIAVGAGTGASRRDAVPQGIPFLSPAEAPRRRERSNFMTETITASSATLREKERFPEAPCGTASLREE